MPINLPPRSEPCDGKSAQGGDASVRGRVPTPTPTPAPRPGVAVRPASPAPAPTPTPASGAAAVPAAGLTQSTFLYIREFARTHAAIVLEAGKEYLVESRLTPIAKQQGFETLDAFVDHLRNNRESPGVNGQSLKQIVLDALTTNETSFFRDFHPFEALKKEILPRLVQERAAARRLTIWSAASSTGQEAYTIAMVIKEHFPQLRDWDVSIIGTDLSSAVLKQAQEGRFSQLEVNRGLPAPLLIKYFAKDGDRWKVKDDVRKLVDFRPMNLVQPWPVLPPFDIIFIRNVMIYFDVETKKGILRKMRGCMMPHSYLFLGTAETTVNLDTGFDQVAFGNTVVYRMGAGPKKA